MEEVSFTKYKKDLLKVGIPEEDIYDFTNDPIASFYQRYFDWSVDNLKDNGYDVMMLMVQYSM